MNTTSETPPSTDSFTIGGNEGFERGLTIEHVLLSVMIVSTKESAGQFDDSCSRIIRKHISEYHGVVRVEANVLYEHTKIEQHPNDCKCGKCKPAASES